MAINPQLPGAVIMFSPNAEFLQLRYCSRPISTGKVTLLSTYARLCRRCHGT